MKRFTVWVCGALCDRKVKSFRNRGNAVRMAIACSGVVMDGTRFFWRVADFRPVDLTRPEPVEKLVIE